MSNKLKIKNFRLKIPQSPLISPLEIAKRFQGLSPGNLLDFSGSKSEHGDKSPLYVFPENKGGQSSMNNSGVALIIVVAIIAVLSAIGVTFMYEMRLEEKAAFNYMNSLKASYIARSGIEHAIAVLKEDGGDTGYDSYTEKWGYDTDINGVFSAYINDKKDSVDNDTFSGTVSPGCTEGRDSRWIYLQDDNGDTVGRYAVLIIDESGKVNINTAGNVQANQGWKPFEISLERFLTAGNWPLSSIPNSPVSQEQTLADRIVNYRQGSPDGMPPWREAGQDGVDDNADSIILEHDGIDNDADGTVDEVGEGVDDPYEFVSWKPYYLGNINYDTPFITSEEIKNINQVGSGIYSNLKPYITVYSSDENTNDSGFLRMNINLVKDATALYTVMYDAWSGLIGSPNYTYDYIRRLAAQCAVNTIDYADTDNVSTFLEIDDGQDTPIARGVEAIRINEIMVKPAYQWEAEELFESELESVGTDGWHEDDPETGIYSTTKSETINGNIQLKRTGFYRLRVLSYSTSPCKGAVQSADPNGLTFTAQGTPGWTTDEWIDAKITISSGTGEGQTRWVESNTPSTVTVSKAWTTIPGGSSRYRIAKDHSFRVRIYDGNDVIFEDTAGEHNIGGWLLEDKGVVEVEETGAYPIDYQIELQTSNHANKDTNAAARVDYIQLSQQPDCEYVELVNISDRDINIGEWTLQTPNGWIGIIPTGTIIQKKDYMVLVGDRDDKWAFMKDKEGVIFEQSDDNICFKNTWGDIVNCEEHVRALEHSASPVDIAENIVGETIILPGSILEDSPLLTPKRWGYSGTYTNVNNNNNTLTVSGFPWDVDEWKGATITALIKVDGADTQITRQIISNRTNNEVTISGKWVWDSSLSFNVADAPNYYIFFTPAAVTLWEGALADRKIVAQVDYLAQDVNQICYTQTDGTPVYGFVALEKNDPTAISDNDGDDIDDSWLINIGETGHSMRGGTPGGINSVATKDPANPDPKKTIRIRNLPFATIGDIKEVSTSDTTNEWSKIGWDANYEKDDTDLIVLLADKITVSEKRLEAENCRDYNGAWLDEYPAGDTFLTPYYSTGGIEPATWVWGIDQRINPDTAIYTLYISGKVLRGTDDPDTMMVRVTTGVEPLGYDDRALSFSPDNIAEYGQIAIGGDVANYTNNEGLLQIEIWNDYLGNTISFDAAILAPEYRTYGRININTADTVILQALPEITPGIADAIVNYRENTSPFDNIGEILDVTDATIIPNGIGLDTFSKISNLITTKSKVFKIISQGQSLRRSDKGTELAPDGYWYEILGDKKYIVVMER